MTVDVGASAHVHVKHHIYTSFGGYGSLKSSDDLEPAMREALDERVAPIAGAAGADGLRSCFPVGPYVATTRTFMLGVDHAGRPRSVAHTIVLDRATAVRLPWFCPLGISRELFLRADTAARGVEGAMTADVPLEAVCPPIDPDEVAAAARSPAASALLAALATRSARTAVLGEPMSALKLLRALAPLVPAARRCDVAVLSGTGAGTVVEASAVILVVRQLADLAYDDEIARVDAATGKLEGRLVRGVASFALSAYLEDQDPLAIERLEACFARWAEDELPGEIPRPFVRAFAFLRPFVHPDGSIGLADEAWPDVAGAIPAAAEGSARGLAAALLADGVGRAAQVHDPERVRAVLRTLRESIAAGPIPEDARKFLAAEVAGTMGRLTEGKEAMPRWKEAHPEAIRAVAHEAEALLSLLLEPAA